MKIAKRITNSIKRTGTINGDGGGEGLEPHLRENQPDTS
jgi:hypothetical protein